MDQLSSLLRRFKLSARVFHTGELCGLSDYGKEGDVGHLHLVRAGTVTVHHPGNPSLHIDTPTLLFYPRALSHRLVVPPNSAAEVLCATIAFQNGAQNPLARALPDYLQIALDRLAELAPTLGLLFDEAFRSRSGKQLILDRLCDVLVVQVIRHAIETNQVATGMLAGMADAGLAHALMSMHDDPAQPWNLEQLAKLAGMSRSRFAARFHEVVGTTPADYLTGWRIVLAQSLLEKNRPVKTVALDVGYGSQPAFTKAFTSRIGMSPRAWLQRTRSG
ncbi:MAG: AraC family transcriptional regulator [Burkholderiales bacterium RIFCSPLOWO2_02_FULL_57_36]|nr:MAG: AraC family transcriptional regulator [Burkholderiales bacterium RIFCSPLOWO2_02_FULL_57_36]